MLTAAVASAAGTAISGTTTSLAGAGAGIDASAIGTVGTGSGGSGNAPGTVLLQASPISTSTREPGNVSCPAGVKHSAVAGVAPKERDRFNGACSYVNWNAWGGRGIHKTDKRKEGNYEGE